MNSRSRGFTLVEVMIGLVIAGITTVIVLNVLMRFQSRKQSVTGTNDVTINAALGLYAMEREARMAGAGYMDASGMACGQGVNIAHDGTAIADGTAVMPLTIADGGADPDQISIVRSNAEQGLAPASVVEAMQSAVSHLVVDRGEGFNSGDLILVMGGLRQRCTLMQLTDAPTAHDGHWQLSHGSVSPYNPAVPDKVFSQVPLYQPGDRVVNLGSFGQRRFQVVCDAGANSYAASSCDLKWFDPLALGAAPAMGNTGSVAKQVVDLQAQYGIAPAGGHDVNQWVDATGPWAGVPAPDQIARIKAVRIAIVTRGQLERQAVTRSPLVLWDAGTPGAKLRVLDGAESRYHYQVLSMVVPLINVIWAGE